MEARVELRSEQRLALLPEMLQSLQILQLAAQDLEAFVVAEFERNEALELRRPAAERREARGGEFSAVDLAPAPEPDLQVFLRAQLAWLECPADLTETVLAVAEHLDERGLLTSGESELAATLPGADVAPAIALLRTLEPKGIGAASTTAAMLTQLDSDDPDRARIEVLLTSYLEELARNRQPQVAHALAIDVPELQRLLARIRALDPRPGAAFARQPAEWVRPELCVELTDDDVVVSFVAQHLPALRVSARCAALAAEGDAELRAYLRPKLAAARDLIRAVDLRRHTLLAVTTAVMRRQTAFLGEGPRSLLPLRMQEVADAIGVHASTVSRAVAGKWVITPQGTYPLRDFFDTGGATTPRGSDAVGQRGVQARIAELIAGEDPRRPLSDDELSALLASAGVQIARRTVAKHRKELGLPGQSRRRAH